MSDAQMPKLHGKHLIAGRWVTSANTFQSSPAHGPAHDFYEGTVDLVNGAAKAAEGAFWQYSDTTAKARAEFLNTIAEEIDAHGDVITQIGSSETGLPTARLEGERGRTTAQLRLFAQYIAQGDHLEPRHDSALPERSPLPRPDLRLVQRPLGPVAIFGASNFPLAFSVAGGDTASALAAGCPVVIKGHPAHPGTSEIVATAIDAAIQKCGMPQGVFSLIHGQSNDVGIALVRHPLISAVGFTGSLKGGRALYDLCASRAVPIPFFGELGSINPMFILPHALTHRAQEIASAWAASLTMGAGQFCTNPGIAIVASSDAAEPFIKAAHEALAPIDAQIMLTDGIAHAYHAQSDQIAKSYGVRKIMAQARKNQHVLPHLYATTGDEWLGNHLLREEVFGPLGIVVIARDQEQMLSLAKSLEGQLTCTLHLDEEDTGLAKRIMPILERKAGRILANGFPTGVEVCDAMVHGGPYPASTNFGHTSVGTLAIRRFLRPVSYQNMPPALLPQTLSAASDDT